MMRIRERYRRALSVILKVALLSQIAAFAGAQPYAPDVSVGNPADQPLLTHDCNDPDNPLANCGFETATYASWVPNDAAVPFFPLTVDPGGTNIGFGFFTSAPSEGSWTALHGFDGGGPDTIELAQDVTIPPGSTGNLVFDYRGAWDLLTFGATLDRTFEVYIEPAGGGAPMQTDLILTAVAGTMNLDTGNLEGNVDLSAFLGQTVRVNFVWNIPENFSGPGFFQLDNVLVDIEASSSPVEIPTLTGVGLAILVLLLIAASIRLLSRRRAA